MSVAQQTSPLQLVNIQALRAMAALLVLFSHLPSIEAKHSPDALLPNFIRLGISGVDLFFVISGFIMVYITWTAPRSLRHMAKFSFARLTRIYPIYWLIAGAVYLAWRLYPDLVNVDPSETDFVRSFLLWPDQTLPFLKVAWTLIHELYFYLIFALILLLPKRYLMPALSLWILCVIIGNILGWGQISPETALIFHPMSLEFYFGCVAGWIYMKRDKAYGLTCLCIGAALWVIALTYQMQAPRPFMPSDWMRVALFGVSATFITYGATAMEARHTVFPRVLQRLGNQSYSLYLSHILTLSVCGVVWQKFANDGALDNLIALPLMTGLSLGVGYLFWRFGEQVFNAFFKRLRARLFRA